MGARMTLGVGTRRVSTGSLARLAMLWRAFPITDGPSPALLRMATLKGARGPGWETSIGSRPSSPRAQGSAVGILPLLAGEGGVEDVGRGEPLEGDVEQSLSVAQGAPLFHR